jgi:hypothetical protein
MAQASAVLTYDAIGNREDLTDVIATITRNETPIYSTLEKVSARATLHEWQIDTLSTGNVNHAIEGADFAFAYPAYRSRVNNHTQIFTKSVEVSETQRAVSVAGLDDEFAYQLEKRMKEIATDIEKALITGTGSTGASGTARDLHGILGFMTTNVETGTGTSTTEVLTEGMYNNALQTIWAAGGRPDTTYVNGFQKRKISSFSSNNTRFMNVDSEGELKNSISVYESDFGRQRIELDPFMTTSVVAILQKDMWKVAQLRPLKVVDVATVGDAKRGALVTELTLEARNEASSGQITGLSTS